MFLINDDQSIYITRGDMALFQVSAKKNKTDLYKFEVGDVIRFKVYEKKGCENVVLQKDFEVEEETDVFNIFLDETETRFGEIINKPKDYWYEVEVKHNDNVQTIIGYDENGAKVFRLFPKGGEIAEE